ATCILPIRETLRATSLPPKFVLTNLQSLTVRADAALLTRLSLRNAISCYQMAPGMLVSLRRCAHAHALGITADGAGHGTAVRAHLPASIRPPEQTRFTHTAAGIRGRTGFRDEPARDSARRTQRLCLHRHRHRVRHAAGHPLGQAAQG